VHCSELQIVEACSNRKSSAADGDGKTSSTHTCWVSVIRRLSSEAAGPPTYTSRDVGGGPTRRNITPSHHSSGAAAAATVAEAEEKRADHGPTAHCHLDHD